MTPKAPLYISQGSIGRCAGGGAPGRSEADRRLLVAGATGCGLGVLHMDFGGLSGPAILVASLVLLAILWGWGSRGVTDFAVRGLILTIPVSFRSVLGTSYDEMPISWFNIFEVLMVLCAVLRPVPVTMRSRAVSPLIVLLFLFAFVPALGIASDSVSALKQYLHFIALAALVLSAEQIRDLVRSAGASLYIRLYVTSVEVTAFALLCQIAAARLWGISVGTQIVMGGQREAFGGSFSDFSYLSIFLATGAAMNYAAACTAARGKKWRLGETSLLLLVSILTTARAGFAAFGLGVIAWHSVDLLAWRRLRARGVIAFAVAVVGCVALWSVISKLREDMWDDSGRREGYRVAVSALENNAFFGVGLGVSAYRRNIGEAIPHNSAIQYLVQGGMIGFCGILLLGIAITQRAARAPAPILAAYLVALAGSQFVPDLLNSRFFPVLCILALAATNWSSSAVLQRTSHNPAFGLRYNLENGRNWIRGAPASGNSIFAE